MLLQPGEPVEGHENRSLMSMDRLGPEKLYIIQKGLRKGILADCVCKRLQFRNAEKIYKDASEQVQLRHNSTFQTTLPATWQFGVFSWTNLLISKAFVI